MKTGETGSQWDKYKIVVDDMLQKTSTTTVIMDCCGIK